MSFLSDSNGYANIERSKDVRKTHPGTFLICNRIGMCVLAINDLDLPGSIPTISFSIKISIHRLEVFLKEIIAQVPFKG